MTTASTLELVAHTTIKVPTELRDEINRAAREKGLSAAAYLRWVMGEIRHQERMAAVGRAFAGGLDDEYLREMEIWDQALMDGLDGF